MKRWTLYTAICLSLLATRPASATFVYISGAPKISGSAANIYTSVSAETFTLSAPATLRGVRFFTNEYPPAWDGTLDYFFFGNNGVFPTSAPLPDGQGHNPAFSKTYLVDGGTTRVSIAQYDFDLITPLTLDAGTYWLGLHMQDGFVYGPVASPSWLGTTTPNAQIYAYASGGDFSNWQLGGLQLAFALSDTLLAVPEPSLLLPVNVCLAALLWRRRRLARTR